MSAALVLTLLLQRLFPYPFLFLFFAAVIMSAWLGGLVSGFLAVFLSTLAADYFLIRPVHSFAVSGTEGTYFAAFVVCVMVGSWVSSFQKKSQDALKAAHDRLEMQVTERTAELQQSNAGLRDSERQLRLLTEAIPQHIWSCKPDGWVNYCNRRLLDYVGRDMDQIEGWHLLNAVHPEDRSNFCEAWQEAMSSGRPFEGEWRLCGADGQYRSFFTRGVPFRDAKGQIIRWYGTATDIEEHKKAEQALVRMRAELAHLSRVLTMAELTSSIAHEVNQPLAAVVTHGQACLEWLSSKPPNLNEVRQAVERIVEDGTRAGAVLSHTRTLFMKGTPAWSQIDMNTLIKELVALVRDEATRHRISIRTELAAHLPRVMGNWTQLQQVVLNLIMNGIDAMREMPLDPRELLISSQKQSASSLLIRVEDNGIGLREEIAERIFEPFFTTKTQGIGMGLPISRSIIESHRGRLWAVPCESGGTAFQFTLPIRSQESHD